MCVCIKDWTHRSQQREKDESRTNGETRQNLNGQGI